MEGTVNRPRRNWHVRGATLCSLSAALAGCGGSGETTPGDIPEVRVVEGAPIAGPAPEHVNVAMDAKLVPTTLALYHGSAAVGTSGGVLVGSLVTNDLEPLVVVPTGDEPAVTGAVARLPSRPSGGMFALAEKGLFHDGQGVLLYSPLNASPELAQNPVLGLDAAGGDDAEELWIRTQKGMFYLAAGKMTGFEVQDAGGTAQAVDTLIGLDHRRALAVASGVAYEIDFGESTVKAVADGIGLIHEASRAEDGVVYIASDTGLYVRDPANGEVSVRTLAPAGEPPQAILAVAASFGTVVAATAKSLVRIDAEGAVQIVDFAAAPADAPESSPVALAVDGQGDVWSLGGGKLVRHITGAPVSFEEDVKPFLVEHCAVCHQDGLNGAPAVDFADYEVAKDRAPTIVKRLKGDGSVMPPVTFQVLTAADYAAVIRWVAGGLSP